MQTIALNSLLFLLAFFVSWGSGLQTIFTLDTSKIFVGLALIVIIFWVLNSKDRFVIPVSLKYFLFFVLIHTAVTYTFFYPSEFSFRYAGEVYLQNEVVRNFEDKGILILRFFLFAILGIAIARLIENEMRLKILILGYSVGLTLILLLGGYMYVSADMEEVRIAGGYLDPNSLGLTGLTVGLLNLSLYLHFKIEKWSIFFVLMGAVGCLAVLLSSSRGAMLGLLVGFVIVIVLYKGLVRRGKAVLLILIFSLIALTQFNPQVIETIEQRLSVQKAI